MALPVTITGISTALAPVGPFKVAAGTYSAGAGITAGVTQVGNTPIWGNSTQTAVGQTFTNGASALIIPSAVALFGSLTGSPTGNVYCEITSTDMNGSVLATSNTIAASACAGSVTFTFASPPTISASATFGVRFWRTVADGSNYVTIGTATSTVYTGGNAFRYNGSTWSDASADLVLTVNKAITIAADCYYFFGRDGTTASQVRAVKATDPSSSWSLVSGNAATNNTVGGLAGCQVGYVIHLIMHSLGGNISYFTFNTATDTFMTTPEAILTGTTTNGQTGAYQAGCSLVVRSSGEVVAFYNGLQTKTSGTFYARVYYSRRTAVNTWSAGIEVDANVAGDNVGPIVVLGAADRLHFIFHNSTQNVQRHLTSANVLGTAAAIAATSARPMDVVTVNDSGTIKHVGFSASTAYRWTSADNPTVSTANISFGLPLRGVDDSLIVYALYIKADGDPYLKSSSDFGATWSAESASTFAATIAQVDANFSKNQTAYQRGSNVVFPYTVNDNGTLKYNEYIVRTISAPTSKTWVRDAGTWKLATTWVKDAGTWKKPTASFVKKTGVWTQV